MSHLRDSSRIIGDWSIRVGCQRDSQRRKHADRRDSDTVKSHVKICVSARTVIADQHRHTDDDHRSYRRKHAERQSADNHRSRPRLTG